MVAAHAVTQFGEDGVEGEYSGSTFFMTTPTKRSWVEGSSSRLVDNFMLSRSERLWLLRLSHRTLALLIQQ
jgi:hypothetical protein